MRTALWPLIGDEEPPPLSTSGLQEVMKELAASGSIGQPSPKRATTAAVGEP